MSNVVIHPADAGSNSSAEDMGPEPLSPPATSTWPLASSVEVSYPRAKVRPAVPVTAGMAGLYRPTHERGAALTPPPAPGTWPVRSSVAAHPARLLARLPAGPQAPKSG